MIAGVIWWFYNKRKIPMPYADPDVQREFHRQLFAVRYRTDSDFREAESYRKARWYQKNREKILEKIGTSQRKSSEPRTFFELEKVA